jgi:hypothetical protein
MNINGHTLNVLARAKGTSLFPYRGAVSSSEDKDDESSDIVLTAFRFNTAADAWCEARELLDIISFQNEDPSYAALPPHLWHKQSP